VSEAEKSGRVFEQLEEIASKPDLIPPSFLSDPPSTKEHYAASLCQVLGENYSEVISPSSLSSLHRKLLLNSLDTGQDGKLPAGIDLGRTSTSRRSARSQQDKPPPNNSRIVAQDTWYQVDG